MERKIELYVGEMVVHTSWIPDDKENLLNAIRPMREQFLALMSAADPDIKGNHAELYEMDADDFGTPENPEEVVKYMITLSPLENEGFTETWRD